MALECVCGNEKKDTLSESLAWPKFQFNVGYLQRQGKMKKVGEK
jgi:hypothetical protein